MIQFSKSHALCCIVGFELTLTQEIVNQNLTYIIDQKQNDLHM
jgi:hypothetical protein